MEGKCNGGENKYMNIRIYFRHGSATILGNVLVGEG